VVAAYLDVLTPPAKENATSHQGGAVFRADKWTRLRRFLILGSETGSIYQPQKQLLIQNVKVVQECLEEDADRTLGEIVDISENGRAAKTDAAILALAMASVADDDNMRRAAYFEVPTVCRTGTHILHFAAYRKALGGGWGRGMRAAVGEWFTNKTPRDLAYQAVKYPSRDGWALRDLLRLAHPSIGDYWPNLGMPRTVQYPNHLLRYITKGAPALVDLVDLLHRQNSAPSYPDWATFLMAVEVIKRYAAEKYTAQELAEICDLIREYRIPREALPTQLLGEPVVWSVLLQDMPLGAMIRNLGKMSSIGVLGLDSENEAKVLSAMDNAGALRTARVHPLAILNAFAVYSSGRGLKGSLSWTPNKRIVSALDEAFYMAFGTISPSNARIRLAVDVSGSMHALRVSGMEAISAATGAAAMALITASTEPRADIVAFSHTMVELPISPDMRLDAVLAKMRAIPYGGTIVSLPIVDAAQQGIRDIEAFVTYTDNETINGYQGWGGFVSTSWGPRSRERVEIPTVSAALRDYRQRSGTPTRNVVVAFSTNEISVADPADPGQLDVAGFDTQTPQLLSDFIAGTL
jgi:60 kDa SS-A/Ro ribonucleoprotein